MIDFCSRGAGHVVAFEDSLTFQVDKLGDYRNMIFSGEGLVCKFTVRQRGPRKHLRASTHARARTHAHVCTLTSDACARIETNETARARTNTLHRRQHR